MKPRTIPTASPGLLSLSSRGRAARKHGRVVGSPSASAFTLTDLIVVLGTLAILVLMILPALATSRPDSRSFQCLNNLKQMTAGWRMWSDDHNDWLVDSSSTYSSPDSPSRPIWMLGNFDSRDSSQWDPSVYIATSVLWPYVGRNPALFRCPADESWVILPVAYNGLPAGSKVPRVRSISMSDVFGRGVWLPSSAWRTYAKGGEIVAPAETFLFTDENPGSISGGAFDTNCSNNQPTNAFSGTYEKVPGNWHNGACGISFADGHSEIHKWRGIFKGEPASANTVLTSGIANDLGTVADCHWLAQMSTVAK